MRANLTDIAVSPKTKARAELENTFEGIKAVLERIGVKAAFADLVRVFVNFDAEQEREIIILREAARLLQLENSSLLHRIDRLVANGGRLVETEPAALEIATEIEIIEATEVESETPYSEKVIW